MVSKNVFKTGRAVPAFDTVNKAGGKAYSLDNEKALCQYAVTNCFNNTYYSTSGELLEEVKKIVAGCSSELVAKAAVYAHEQGAMKDMPAYLLAVLAARGELDLLRKAFPRVITNAKMLCNFVQIVRSGATGRKSFGTAVKTLIRNWITSRRPDQLFFDDIGKGNPSIGDIIKMVHVKATSEPQNNMLKYVLGKDFDKKLLPQVVANFECFKKDSSGEVPAVDFRVLSNLTLTDEQWKTVARNMPWNTLRMNLNQLAKHNVFTDRLLTAELAAKLSNKELVEKSNAFPYQLLTTYQNATNIPIEMKNALHMAMEFAVDNVPSFDKDVAVCIDVSGSMGSPITGHRVGATSVTRCVDVAALIGSAVIRRNKNALVLPFDTAVHNVHINPFDSVLTNAQKLGISGGGTACSSAMNHLLKSGEKRDLVIFVSDNMSWYDFMHTSPYYGGGGLAPAWVNYKAKNKAAKLVLIDLTPNTAVQVKPQPDVLNVGGFSDGVWEVIKNFVTTGSGDEFVNTVRAVAL